MARSHFEVPWRASSVVEGERLAGRTLRVPDRGNGAGGQSPPGQWRGNAFAKDAAGRV